MSAALPAAANESRSANFSNLSLDGGSATEPPQFSVSPPPDSPLPRPRRERAAPLPAETKAPPPAVAAAAPAGVPAPTSTPWSSRPIIGAGALFAAAAWALRRRVRRQANETLAVAAHELKSPLAALESYMALMEQEGKTGAAADTRAWLEDIARMRSTAAHLRRTIGGILEMTRLDDAGIKLEPRAMDIAAAARETAAAYEQLAAEAGIKLTLRPAPAPAWGDPTRVRQILDNLVANALRHAPAGGEVAVSTGADPDGRAWCAVADDGDGVPPSQAGRLFSRFARLSPPLRGEHGTGLGLYIGRNLARAQGGALEYKPQPGVRGGRFRLTLPRARRE